MWAHSEKAALYKLGKKSSLETKFAGTLILNFSASRTAIKKFELFKPPIMYYFVVAALAGS